MSPIALGFASSLNACSFSRLAGIGKKLSARDIGLWLTVLPRFGCHFLDLVWVRRNSSFIGLVIHGAGIEASTASLSVENRNE